MKRTVIFFLVGMITLGVYAQNRTLYSDSVASKDSIVHVKGNYIFVPDSMIDEVRGILNKKITQDVQGIDVNEKVVVKGDTVNLIIKQRNLGRYDRGLFNYLFIPKGTWLFGLTASYGEYSSDDLQLLNILSEFDFSGHTFSIKPSVSYFVRSNMSVGLRLGYTQGRATLGKLAMDFDDDLNFDIANVDYRNESYTAALNLRQYIGLSRMGRFGVFNEVELSLTSGTSDFRRNYDSQPKITHTKYTDLRLGFSPGVCVFIMKNVSFNVSFGVFGFYLHDEKQSVNGEQTGSRITSGANFRFNIFNINFGVGVHI